MAESVDGANSEEVERISRLLEEWPERSRQVGLNQKIITTDCDTVASKLGDESGIVGTAQALLRPRNLRDVSLALRLCHRMGLPVTVTGERSGLVGGTVPANGLLLDLSSLARAPEVDEGEVTCRPGLTIGSIDDMLREEYGCCLHGLPTSKDQADVCAVLVTSASGADSLHWGSLSDHLLRAKVIIPDGRMIDLPGKALDNPPINEEGELEYWRLPARQGLPCGWEVAQPVDWLSVPSKPELLGKRAEGPRRRGEEAHPLDLVVSSEGMFGILVEVTLATYPITPVSQMAWWVDDWRVAGDLGEWLKAKHPDEVWSMEYIDSTCLKLPKPSELLPDGKEGMSTIFLTLSGESDEWATRMVDWEQDLSSFGARLDDCEFLEGEAGKRMVAMRGLVPEQVNELQHAVGGPKLGGDWVHPDGPKAALEYIHEKLKGSLFDRDGGYIVYGHLGNGHLHPNLIPKDFEEVEDARTWLRECMQEVYLMGGAFSGEHGVGRRHRDTHEGLVSPERLNFLKSAKRALDPRWVLNRGVMISEDDF